VAEPRDPGLQAERTALAWQRTALTSAGTAALVLRLGEIADNPVLIATGVLLAGTAAGAYVAGRMRVRRVAAALGAGRSAASPVALRLLALVVSLAGLAVLPALLL
jgi:uncharacterized membrane protein YidH (DUF202 family)